MKLKCELQTVYRCGAGTQPPSRKSQGLLVLSGRSPELLVTAYTSRNVRGRQYRVDSLKKVFMRHAADGKTSLSFSEPQHDLLVTGDPVQVRAFLKQLAGASRGSLPATAAPVAAPARVQPRQLARPPTRLSVKTSAEYVAAFPAGLQQLAARGIRLRRVEERLLRLNQLRSLDLSGNRLRRVPALDARLPQLCELRLAGNLLDRLEPLAEAPRRSQLAYLDVSGNRLTELPATLGFLTRLHFLNAGDNQLAELPDCLCNLRHLRVLNVANNRLCWLPAQLERMPLMELDASGNPGGVTPRRLAARAPLSLLLAAAAAAAAQLRGRLPSPAELPLCLLQLLQQSLPCSQCSRPCYPDGNCTQVGGV